MDLTTGLFVTLGPVLLFALTLWVGKLYSRYYIKKYMPNLLEYADKKK